MKDTSPGDQTADWHEWGDVPDFQSPEGAADALQAQLALCIDEVPAELVCGRLTHKVQKTWWQGAFSAIELIRKHQAERLSPRTRLFVGLFLDTFGAEEGFAQRLTTAVDISFANALLAMIIDELRSRMVEVVRDEHAEEPVRA